MSNQAELEVNAAEWMRVADQRLPKDMGCIMIFMDRSVAGQGYGVCVSNMEDKVMAEELRHLLKKFKGGGRIVIPFRE